MNDAFKKLKARSKSGEDLAFIRTLARYDLGAHKKTKLRKAGVVRETSLLHDEVSKKHALKMEKEFHTRVTKIGQAALPRLRFLTILHSVEKIELRAVSSAVCRMEAEYQKVLGRAGVWSRGAVELEIVNLTMLQEGADSGEGEARKFNVLTDLINAKGQKRQVPHCVADTRVLVHLHSVVDLGSSPEVVEPILRENLHDVIAWSKPYQIELKGLFTTQSLSKNLRSIATYVTKGGNNTLRYNSAFGRDRAEDIEIKLWRRGLGRADKGAEMIEDERSLTIAEVTKLDELYTWLMKRRRDNRGYILATP